ncbi:MAG: MGMT family protein [Chloroflexota bacterium]|nr:MGMT family protein [Chloroflexota bacterium]
MNFRDAVYALVSRIPPGRVMTYGQVAASLGLPRAARAVGTALHYLPDPTAVPWWRVINREGRISTRCFDHPPEYQRHLLLEEGVVPDADGVISLARYRWWPSPEEEAACRVTAVHLDRLGEALQPRRAPGRRRGSSSSPARRTWSGTPCG